MGRSITDEQRAVLYPDPNKQKLQRSKDVFAAASNGGQIQPTPYELASGAKAPTPPANLGAVQKNNTPGAPLGLTVGSTIDKNATTYDETSFRNPQVKARGADTPRMGAKLGPGLTLTQDGQGNVSFFGADGKKLTPAEARLSARQSGQKEQTGVFSGYSKTTGPGGVENFSPNFSTPTQPAPQQGGNPFFIKSTAAQGLVPQPGTASAVPGMEQNPASSGVPGGNWTGMLNQDNALFKAQMADVKSGFRGPGIGNPAFATDGGYADKQYKRDQLISQLASFDRANPTANMTPGQLIASRQSSSGLRGQLDTINAELLQADELATRAKLGILDATTSRANNAATNMTSSENQKLENQGTNEVWSMREGNENLRHAASLAAGQYAAKTNPKDDPYNNLYPDSLKEYFKTQLTNNPNRAREEYAEMVHSATTSLKNKTGGAGNGITKDRLDKY